MDIHIQLTAYRFICSLAMVLFNKVLLDVVTNLIIILLKWSELVLISMTHLHQHTHALKTPTHTLESDTHTHTLSLSLSDRENKDRICHGGKSFRLSVFLYIWIAMEYMARLG